MKVDNTTNSRFCASLTSLCNLNLKRRTTAKKRKSTTMITPDVNLGNVTELEEVDTNSMKELSNKFLGKYTVKASLLEEPPTKYLVRPTSEKWVGAIKESIRKTSTPLGATTIFPVLIDPKQLKNIDDFRAEKMVEYKLLSIGGNHLRCAIKDLFSENPSRFSSFETVTVKVFCCLTVDETKLIANQHNASLDTLQMTFQDKVLQARELFTRNPGNGFRDRVAANLTDMTLKDVSADSITTVTSVASYEELTFEEVNKMFTEYEAKHGPTKSFPQKIFRALQGTAEGCKLKTLKTINQGVHTIGKAVLTLEKKKKIMLLNEIFFKITNSSADNARVLYPNHFDRIEEFCTLAIGKTVPKLFLDFCEGAKNEAVIPYDVASSTIDITIQIPGCSGDIHNNFHVQKLINKHKLTLKKELCKIKHKLNVYIVDRMDVCDDTIDDCSDLVATLDESGIIDDYSAIDSNDGKDCSLVSSETPSFESISASCAETQCPLSCLIIPETPMSQL
ncbi:uncharacterized protein LOC134691118 [Mytilus trossulus]